MNIFTKNNKPISDWTEDEWIKFREWLLGMLYVSPVTVIFTKKDGSERTMNCTLLPDMLPKVEIKENKQPKKKSDSVISVYDLDQKGWRSFTLKSVKQVKLSVTSD